MPPKKGLGYFLSMIFSEISTGCFPVYEEALVKFSAELAFKNKSFYFRQENWEVKNRLVRQICEVDLGGGRDRFFENSAIFWKPRIRATRKKNKIL